MDKGYHAVLNVQSSRRFVTKYLGLIALLVSLIIVTLFLAFNIAASNSFVAQLEEQGRSFFHEIVITRKWVAQFGGVYVPLDKTIGVNKYLEQIHGVKSVISCEGREYTLKNPALVTRELSESPGRFGRLKYKITSLKPINPSNAPDEFERESLLKFELGKEETTTFAKMDGQLFYRYMAPLKVVDACMKCHAQQGYKVGDVRGGIAVSILAEEVSKKIAKARLFMVLGGVGVVALVVASILYISRYFIRDLQKAEEALVDMAMTDYLTGLYNRLTGMRMLQHEVSRSRRTTSPLSIALLDIDYFKRVNDTYGHTAGDVVLVELAGILQEGVREYDILFRYGGEEFMLVMPETRLKDAEQVMERLRRRTEETTITLPQGETLCVTFSCGVAQRSGDESVEALTDRADSRLYAAKADGRNRVYCAEDESGADK